MRWLTVIKNWICGISNPVVDNKHKILEWKKREKEYYEIMKPK